MSAYGALAEPHRRQILDLLREGERPAGELVEHLALSQPGVSKHLKVLREAGLVTVRRDGKRRLYRADHERLGPLKHFLETFWGEQLDRLATLAEEVER